MMHLFDAFVQLAVMVEQTMFMTVTITAEQTSHN
jgi:hypothetical protein